MFKFPIIIYTINDSNGVSSPCDEILWFRPKYPKPCWPWHGPSGALRGSPTLAAGKLAGLKQCPPFLRCRLYCSAMPSGQGNVKGEGGPTRVAQTRPASSLERPLRGPDSRHWSLCNNRLDQNLAIVACGHMIGAPVILEASMLGHRRSSYVGHSMQSQGMTPNV